MRNTPDDRRPCWSLLPPGVLLELTAVRVSPTNGNDRCNPNDSGRRHPVDDDLTALLARAGVRQGIGTHTMLRGGQPGAGVGRWSLRCRVHPQADCEFRPSRRQEALSVHCRLTAAIRDAGDEMPGERRLAAALRAFRLHVQARPFDADARRNLRLYLLLRLLAHGAADEAVLAAIENVQRQERRRMRRRLHGALRRLHRKMSAAEPPRSHE